jgi:hypothetical protein
MGGSAHCQRQHSTDTQVGILELEHVVCGGRVYVVVSVIESV